MNLYQYKGKGQNRYPITPLHGAYVICATDVDSNILLYLGQVKGEKLSQWTTESERAIRFNIMGHQNLNPNMRTTLMKIYRYSLEELKTVMVNLHPNLQSFKLGSYSISEKRLHQALLIEI